ncbi:hypothetical protein GX865_00525 [Candidatus Saccharibacteria bacterium]|nr:hypothetical protein [Candidatus Saccharibacteria bacterium]
MKSPEDFLRLLNSCKKNPEKLFTRLGLTQEEFDGSIMAGFPTEQEQKFAPVIQLFQAERLTEYAKTGLGACV